MLKVLIKKQVSETLYRSFRRRNPNRSGKSGGKGKLSGKSTMIIMIVAALYLVAMFTFFSVGLCQKLMAVELDWLYYLICSGAAIIFGTFGSVFSTSFTLYMAKDNDLLLSMPIPIRDVIISRLFSVYIMSLLYSGLITIPSVVVGLILGGFSFSRLLGGLILVVLISLIVTGLSCLLGWVVAKLSQRLKNRSFLTVLIALLFFGLYYYVYFRIMDRVQDLLEAMIRIGGEIRSSAYFLYIFGLIGNGNWLGMACWTGVVLLALGLIWLILKKTFLSISTATPTPKRAVYKEKEIRQGSVSYALYRKEWYRFTTSANYMLNCGMPLLLLLGAGAFMLIKGRKMILMMSVVLAQVPGTIPVILCAVCCMLGGMVDISTPSVSLEGSTIWQLQCLPVTPWKVLRAKLMLHLSLIAFPTLFSSVVMMLLAPAGTALIQRILIPIISVLNAVFFAQYGLYLGLKLPNLSWTNEIIPIKQSAPIFFVIFTGIGLSFAFGGAYLLLGGAIGATAWMSIFAVLFFVANVALYRWLRGPGSARFAAL